MVHLVWFRLVRFYLTFVTVASVACLTFSGHSPALPSLPPSLLYRGINKAQCTSNV